MAPWWAGRWRIGRTGRWRIGWTGRWWVGRTGRWRTGWTGRWRHRWRTARHVRIKHSGLQDWMSITLCLRSSGCCHMHAQLPRQGMHALLSAEDLGGNEGGFVYLGGGGLGGEGGGGAGGGLHNRNPSILCLHTALKATLAQRRHSAAFLADDVAAAEYSSHRSWAPERGAVKGELPWRRRGWRGCWRGRRLAAQHKHHHHMASLLLHEPCC